jgi:hypothetical protein
MAETDTRTFEKYKVVGTSEILDSRTGEFVGPGGVVELDPNPSRKPLVTGEVQEFAGVQIRALLHGGHIAPLEDDKPAEPTADKPKKP